MLVTVKADAPSCGRRSPSWPSIFEAKIDDVGYDALTIMVAGAPEKLDAMTDLLHAVRHRRARSARAASPCPSWPAGPAKLRAVKNRVV